MDLQPEIKENNAEINEIRFSQQNAQFVERIQEISRKNPFEMLLEQVNYLQRGTQRTTAECQFLVKNGGINIFLSLLQHRDSNFIIEAFYGMGNIAHHSIQNRQQIILKGALQKLMIASKKTKNDMRAFELGIWAMNNFCLDSAIDIEDLKMGIKYFCQLIVDNKMNNQQTLENSLLCISYRKGSGQRQSNQRDNIILQTNLIPSLLQLMNHYNIEIAKNSVAILKDVSSGSLTRYLLDHEIIDKTYPLLFHQNSYIRESICLIYSNIAADSQQLAKILLIHEKTIQTLLMLFKNDAIKVGVQIGYTFANFMIHMFPEDIVQNLFQRCKICLYYAELLIRCEVEQDHKSLQSGLICFERLLNGSQKPYLNGSIDIKKSLFGFDLEGLLMNFMNLPSQEVRTLSGKIIERFF